MDWGLQDILMCVVSEPGERCRTFGMQQLMAVMKLPATSPPDLALKRDLYTKYLETILQVPRDHPLAH